jgi:uncharacterized protein (TIGR02452 family)
MFSKDTRRGDKFKKVARHFNATTNVTKETKETDVTKETEENEGTKGNSRKMNKQTAYQTCEILDTCQYVYNDAVVNISLENSETFTPKDLEHIRGSDKHADNLSEDKNTTKFIIVKTTTLNAIHKFYGKTKLGVLNFASARNPGGGFLKGSDAQEESLARASGLYDTIRLSPMYEANEKDNCRYLYQEYLIYSPNVPIFRDANDELIKEPIYVDIISVPAVNEGEAIKKGVSKLVIDNTRYDRMESFLSVFKLKNIKRIILGAWGCGVFGGSFDDLAIDFYAHLIEGNYKDVFEEVIFAVMDDDHVTHLEELIFTI